MTANPIQIRPVADLTPDPRNSRTHSPDQIEDLVRLVTEYGWTMPIAVDDVIRAGNARHAAAKLIYERGGRIWMAPGEQAGGEPIPEGTIPTIDCTGWSEAQRRAYAIADNKSALNSGWDEDTLRAELAALGDLDFDISLTGFGSAEVDELVKQASAGTGPSSPDEFPEFGEDIETEHKCPKCGYQWSGKAS